MAKKSPNFSRVRELHKAGLLDDAETGYLALLRINPRDPEVLHSLGIVYTQKKDFGEATRYLEDAIRLAPEDPAIPLHLANVLKLQGLFSQAAQLLETTAKTYPDYPPAYNNLGTVYYAQGKLDQAIHAYNDAIKKYPGYVDAYYNLGLALSKKNRFDEATQTYQHLLSLSPEHLAARFHLACIYMQENRIADALKEFLIIETTQPYHFETQTNLASCYLKHGQINEAKMHYLKAIELKPEDTQILFNLGVINMQQGHIDNAIQFYQQAVLINPDFFAAHNNLAVAFLTKQHMGYALKHFQEAFRIQPKNTALNYTIQMLTQNQPLLSAPPEYVQSLFDAYADHYESHLMSALEYKIPEIFQKILTGLTSKTHPIDILDLGCGTGLCGVSIKPIAKKLFGVDLSPNMLAVAAQKQIYDELITQDITTYLTDKHEQFDLIMAGDVFVYMGQLDTILNLAYAALRDQGLIIFNAEIGTESDFKMNQSGRFSHHKSYIDSLAKKYHFNIRNYQTCLTRMQNNEAVYGHLYVLQKGLSC